MRTHLLLLLLLLPLCTAIRCHGKDLLYVNMEIECSGKEKQACYTRDGGERGCARVEVCSRPGWRCCYTDLCNA
uniref:Uncharacterized protein n=1 Tax=Gouania willdenowi TaxID=441366 RepID=A0A8C5GZ32_GOUWI